MSGINSISSFLSALGANFVSGSTGNNEDLERERDQMQRKSFVRSNKVYETNEAKKNAEAVR